ncbi:MAG TPA: hypothetical protein V6C72_18905, partial [Chroococcales cyanobacterium]
AFLKNVRAERSGSADDREQLIRSAPRLFSSAYLDGQSLITTPFSDPDQTLQEADTGEDEWGEGSSWEGFGPGIISGGADDSEPQYLADPEEYDYEDEAGAVDHEWHEDRP